MILHIYTLSYGNVNIGIFVIDTEGFLFCGDNGMLFVAVYW